MKKLKVLWLTPIALALTWLPSASMASGADGYSESTFTPEFHVPPADLPGYAAGKLGIINPSYWRVYQFLAYRALTVNPLSKDELALLNVERWWVDGPDSGVPQASVSGVDAWLKARALVKGAKEVKVDAEADIGNYVTVINCPNDAFNRAAKTLEQRVAQGGQQWAAVWLANQDTVFANCSSRASGPQQARPLSMPAGLPAKAPDWLTYDYAYQSAAALFYAGRYDDARERFLGIAKDAKSPWRNLGKYLAARCLLRKASVVTTDGDKKNAEPPEKKLLKTAREELVALGSEFPAAAQLLGWVDFRLRPQERRLELSPLLASSKISKETPQLLTDYLFLLDKAETAKDMLNAEDPMTMWIGVMQAGDQELHQQALEVARAQWNKRHAPVWLVAVLTNLVKGEAKPAELEAALAVKEDSPAYVDVQYHLARLDIAQGKLQQADKIVSAILQKPLPHYVKNRWLRMKMVTAATAADFIAAAPRQAAEANGALPIPNEGKQGAKAALTFDQDLLVHLMQNFSLAQLKRLKPMLPAEQQKWLGELMWTRAVLLGNYAIADELTADLMVGRETTHYLYDRFKQANTPETKKEVALLILSNTPELGPVVLSVPEKTTPSSIYWSCGGHEPDLDNMGLISPAFLTADERAQAEDELTRLRTLPPRSSYLIPPVIDWAKKHKADPDGPKALHFLVASTRNECSFGITPAKETRHYSKEAFDTLHSQFPKSDWTAQTRYYY